MKRTKKILKFNKIRIANMNSIKGGGDTDDTASELNPCQSGHNCSLTPYEVTVPENPCSDGCLRTGNQPNNNSDGNGFCFLGYCLQP